MKYKVGDVLLVKQREYKPHPHLRPHLDPHRLPLNTLGIITKVNKHSDVCESGSTEDDNGYVWLSQVDGREYHFFENEVECEVIK